MELLPSRRPRKMGVEMRQNVWRSLLIFVLLLVMSVSLVGCGDSSTEEAPAFSMIDATGGSVALADYTGSPVLLFFHMADG